MTQIDMISNPICFRKLAPSLTIVIYIASRPFISPDIFPSTHISGSVVVSRSVLSSWRLWLHPPLPFGRPLNNFSVHKQLSCMKLQFLSSKNNLHLENLMLIDQKSVPIKMERIFVIRFALKAKHCPLRLILQDGLTLMRKTFVKIAQTVGKQFLQMNISTPMILRLHPIKGATQ